MALYKFSCQRRSGGCRANQANHECIFCQYQLPSGTYTACLMHLTPGLCLRLGDNRPRYICSGCVRKGAKRMQDVPYGKPQAKIGIDPPGECSVASKLFSCSYTSP